MQISKIIINADVLTAGVSFSVSSLFWLLISLKISSRQYGEMMMIQAVVQIVSAAFCLRFHDLVHFLMKRHSWQYRRSFLFSFRLEMLLSAFGCCISIFVCPFISKLFVGATINANKLEWAIFIMLGNLAVMHGSAIAYLRIAKLEKIIRFGDALSIFVGCIGIFWSTVNASFSSLDILAVGLSIICIKPIYLNAWSVLNEFNDRNNQINGSKTVDAKAVVLFLFAGQLTNIIKNSLLSFETILLGVFGQPQVVAVYRVSRSFFGITNIMLNTQYQISYASLAVAESAAESLQTINLIAKKSAQIWCASLVPVLVAMLIYLNLNNRSDYKSLPIIVFLMALASLPIALQQGEFGYLTQNGQFGIINKIYILCTATFGLACLAFHSIESLNVFMVMMVIVYSLRYFLFRKKVLRLLQDIGNV